MLRLLRTRRWVGFTALVIGVIIAFGMLSRWQWSRAEDKRLEQGRVESASSQPAIALGEAPPPEWTPVTVRGAYDPAGQVLVRQRPLGGQNGYWVLTPLRADVDDRIVWVNRGWMPAEGPATTTPQSPAPPPGTRVVHGWWRPAETVRDEARSGLPVGMVGAVDPDVLPVRGTLDGYVQQSPPMDDGLVEVPRPQPDEGRNISYAVQWLLFAVVAIVGWWFFLRREAADDRRREHAGAGHP